MRLLPNSGKCSWQNYNLEMVYWLAFYKDRIRVLPKSRFILSTVPAEPPGTLLYSEKKWDRSSKSHTEETKDEHSEGTEGQESRKVKERWARIERIEGTKEEKGKRKLTKKPVLSASPWGHVTSPSHHCQSPFIDSPRGQSHHEAERTSPAAAKSDPQVGTDISVHCSAFPMNILAIWFCRVMVPSCQDPFSLLQFKRRSLSG